MSGETFVVAVPPNHMFSRHNGCTCEVVNDVEVLRVARLLDGENKGEEWVFKPEWLIPQGGSQSN